MAFELDRPSLLFLMISNWMSDANRPLPAVSRGDKFIDINKRVWLLFEEASLNAFVDNSRRGAASPRIVIRERGRPCRSPRYV